MYLSHVFLVRALVAFVILLGVCTASFHNKYPTKVTENDLRFFANDWRSFVKETMLKIQQQQQQQQKLKSSGEGQLLSWSFFIDNMSRFIDPTWKKADREQVRDFYLMLGNGPINKGKENIEKILNLDAINNKNAYELILKVFFTWTLDVYSHLEYIKEDLERIKMTLERVNINLYAYKISQLDVVGATDIGNGKVGELFGFLDSRIAASDFMNLISIMIKLNQPTCQYTFAKSEDPYLLKEDLSTIMERLYGPNNRPKLLSTSSWAIIKNKEMDQYHDDFYKVLMSPLALKCELLKPSTCLVLEYYRRGYQCIRPLDKNELIKLSTSWTQSTGNFIKLDDCNGFNSFLQFLGDQEILRQSGMFNNFISDKLYWAQHEGSSSNNSPVNLPLFYLSTLKSLDSAYSLYGEQSKDWIEQIKVQTQNHCGEHNYASIKKGVGLIILAHLNNPKHNVLGKLMACASNETLKLLPKLESYPLVYKHLIIPELEKAALAFNNPNHGLSLLFIINKLSSMPEKTFILTWNKIEKEGYNIIDTVGYPLNLNRLINILIEKLLNERMIVKVETLSSDLFK